MAEGLRVKLGGERHQSSIGNRVNLTVGGRIKSLEGGKPPEEYLSLRFSCQSKGPMVWKETSTLLLEVYESSTTTSEMHMTGYIVEW